MHSKISLSRVALKGKILISTMKIMIFIKLEQLVKINGSTRKPVKTEAGRQRKTESEENKDDNRPYERIIISLILTKMA